MKNWFNRVRAVIAAAAALLSASAGVAAPPNFIVILVDDLGWADLGCYGSRFHPTPAIDRLAAEGMRFTDAYAAGPVCSPTRASLLTGKSPARLHLTDWLPGRADRPDQKLLRPAIVDHLPSSEITLADALRQHGYKTAHIGKWHLGGGSNGPTHHGFDVNIGGDERGSPRSYLAPYRDGSGEMPGLHESAPGEYLTDRLTTEAEQFLAANRAQPFFIYLAHYAVHIPLTALSNRVAAAAARVAAGSGQTNALYAAMIESVDQGVGRLLHKLDELGLATNTFVIFTSDNGGLSVHEGPNTPATSNAPLRDGKGYLYEGGLRVPLLVRCPGTVPARSSRSTPVSSADLYATLLDLAGAELPAGVRDGVSLKPLLQQEAALAPRALYWHYPHYSNQGGKPAGAIREGDFKLVEHYESGYLELFQLHDDLGERTNLAQALPQKANELQKKLADWRASAHAQLMTTNPAYEAVAVQAGADGILTLPAHDVTIHGLNVRYEPPAHKNTIGYWTRVEDWVSWAIALPAPGTYEVEILQGCGKGSGGSEVEIWVGDQRVSFVVEDTGHFQNFIRRNVGRVLVPTAGVSTLRVKPKRKPGVAVMDLREVRLKPVRG